MTAITVYAIRPDGVYGGEVSLDVRDPVKSPIPAGHTRQSPEPIPVEHYAVMNGGWKYIQGEAPAYPNPASVEAEQAGAIRAERDILLLESDWTQVADAPVDQAAWAAYRQALRDIPQQAGFPWTITWPVKP